MYVGDKRNNELQDKESNFKEEVSKYKITAG